MDGIPNPDQDQGSQALMDGTPGSAPRYTDDDGLPCGDLKSS